MKKPHKTQKTTIKKADVDVDIIPLINYLNGFEGIITRWSCQGDPTPKLATKSYDLPYVTFVAEDLVSLKSLLEHLDGAPCEIIVEYFNEFIAFRFNIRFEDKKYLKLMLEWIKKHDYK